jgi:ketosteroid isomerase-like protein
MSEEDVKIVRRAFEAWETRDDETTLALLHEEIAMYPAQDEPERGTVRGIPAIATYFEQWIEAFDDFRVEPLEFIDAGDCVVVPVHISGRLRGSDGEVAIDETHIYRVRDGKIAEIRDFRTRTEALAAADVTSEGRSDDE